jgi:type II secretory pathway pseudopilin PulG
VKIKPTDPRGNEGEEGGFSLIELLVVMLVTFFVSGAIYALLASGQNSFRREPEIADRQQNIRVAMDVISRDIANAGTNLPAFAQVFTDNDPAGGPALNGLGPPGSLGAPGQAQRNADPSANSDVLEVVAAEDRCPGQTLCNPAAPGAAGSFITKEPNPACLAPAGLANPGFAVLTDNNNMTIQPILVANPQACPAGGGAGNGGVNLGDAVAVGTNPLAPAFTAPAVGSSIYAFLFPARISRYMIGFDPADPDRVPLLFRSVTGRYTAAGAVAAAPPPVPGGPAAGANWQVVARGIEDLQVEYQDGLGNWTNTPPAAIPCGPPGVLGGCANQAAFDAIVRQVRVTLSARVVTQGLQGSQSAGAGAAVAPDRIRGQLVSIIQPRAAMTALEMGNQIR